MAEQLWKLRPDRDLQCYFQRPSAIAALSATSAHGFTLSGCWRQQFDWAVVEWNRDNVFEHPALRNLPDGDLSGVRLSYEEVRSNCIPLDSDLYPTVEWPYLRIWAPADGSEAMYLVPLREHATALAGQCSAASAVFELQGSPATGDYIELAWLDQHFNYQMASSDTLASAATSLAAIITANQNTGRVRANANGNRITLTYLEDAGANGNRLGAYATVFGAGTESWSPTWKKFDGGESPTRWRIDLDFGQLTGYRYPDLSRRVSIPTTEVRKIRWTWAAHLQPSDFEQSEFSIDVTNWEVSGSRLAYEVAGPGSRRIEDDESSCCIYEGAWTESRGNFSGGSIRWTTDPGATVRCNFGSPTTGRLYLGTRCSENGADVSVQVDSQPPVTYHLKYLQEDFLVRIPVGVLNETPEHTVLVTHSGDPGTYLYFDFVEIARPDTALPEFDAYPSTTLATDWDTDHSIAIAPERTAWLIDSLGFHGKANHYAGALWFYELHRPGHQYATATISFSGTPQFGKRTNLWLGGTAISHLNLIGDTGESITKCFELLINGGSTGVWARSEQADLIITARIMGSAGNGITLAVETNSTEFTAEASGVTLAGGTDGSWRTDLTASPRLNRAARDWSRSYFAALKGYGISAAAAFSMELQHGDDRASVGIAQRYPDGTAVWLNTPALQTNFGPESAAFWKQVYLDMADLMAEAGMTPCLQFGEVQWWYFAAISGMPFYDTHTTTTFAGRYGRPLPVIESELADPAQFPEECSFLAGLIGNFTDAVRDCVLSAHGNATFEVLYAPDVNDTPLNRLVNLPGEWNPAKIQCFKTENFTYTGNRDLDKARESIQLPAARGFPATQRSHLIGISDYTTPWQKERQLAIAEGMQSVVLFALDQLCLIGYSLPLDRGLRRAHFMGN